MSFTEYWTAALMIYGSYARAVAPFHLQTLSCVYHELRTGNGRRIPYVNFPRMMTRAKSVIKVSGFDHQFLSAAGDTRHTVDQRENINKVGKQPGREDGQAMLASCLVHRLASTANAGFFSHFGAQKIQFAGIKKTTLRLGPILVRSHLNHIRMSGGLHCRLEKTLYVM